MRKVILSLAIALVAFGYSYGQELKLGGGISFSDVSKISNGEATGKLGAQLGGSLVFGHKFYFEPGIYYATKSTEIINSNDISGENYKTDALIKGIRVPVTVGLNVLGNTESLVNLRVFGGGSGFFVTGTGKDILLSEVEKTNWGLLAGAGVNVWMLFADLSYEWSLTDISNSGADIGKYRSLFGNVGIRLKF